MNVKIREFVVKNSNIVRCGRFTIVEIEADNGVKGVGVARRGFLDKKNDKLGLSIARGRACRAINKKIAKEPIHNAFLG